MKREITDRENEFGWILVLEKGGKKKEKPQGGKSDFQNLGWGEIVSFLNRIEEEQNKNIYFNIIDEMTFFPI